MSRAWLSVLMVVLLSTGAGGQTVLTQRAADRRVNERLDLLQVPANLVIDGATLADALVALTRSSGVPLAFSASLLSEEVGVRCDCQRVTVAEALDSILRGRPFRWALQGRQVVIERRSSTLPQDYRLVLSAPVSEPRPTPFGSDYPSEIPEMTLSRVDLRGTIVGTVADYHTQRPLAAVQVFIEGTSLGAMTNAQGRFTIENVPAGSVTIVAQRIGYSQARETVTVVSGSTASVEIFLTEQALNLEELVVTGLASSIKRRNLANAVATVSGDQLTGTSRPETVDGALRGKLPGVNIRAIGGAPGGGVNMQFRGVSTLGAGSSQPLFIIDGVYVDNSSIGTGRTAMLVGTGTGTNTRNDNASNRIADLNPEDIESIEVLKGPSAAAIYGARANAGVVIITTKRGSAGGTRVRFKQDLGFASALRFLGFDDWSEEKIDLIFPDPARNALEKQRFAEGKRFDWEREIYGELGFLRNSQLDISGGDSRTRFFVSGGIQEEDGIIKNTGFSRRSVRANIDHNLTERIQIGSSSNYIEFESDRGFTDNGSAASIGYNLFNTPNYYDLRPDASGNYPDNPYYRENPFSIRDHAENHHTVRRVIQGVSLNANLMEREQSSLSLSVRGGIDFLNSQSIVYLPEYLQDQRTRANPGDVVHGRQENRNTNWQAFLQYSRWTDRLTLSTQLGLTGQSQSVRNLFVRGQGLAPNQKNMNQAQVQQIFTHFNQDVRDLGVAGQQEVNWQDKVIATAGLRLDRSTLNTRQDHYYAFPKASLAINVANFEFWRWPVFEQVKLRTAYGQTGGLPLYGQTFEVLAGTNIDGRLGSVISGRGVDPDLKPERASEIEVGLDVALWEGRAGFEVTYYRKNVQDLILDLTPAASTGINAIATNAADLRNDGIELSVTASPVRTSRLAWTTQAMFWRNRSKITRLAVPSFTFGGFGLSLGTYLIKEGLSPTTVVGTPAEPEPTIYGDAQPDWDLSWSNTFTIFRNLDFTALIHYQRGGTIINLSQFLMDGGGTTPDWSRDDDGDGIPNGQDRGPAVAGRFIEDGSYLKLREAGLYYTVPRTIANQWFRSSSVRLGLSGQNLFLISDYRSYDPEVSVAGVQPIDSTVEIAPYPSSRRLLFHVIVEF